MAASTLTLTRDDLRKAIGNFLGLGIDSTAWDNEQQTRIDMCVDIGCRMVYEPEVLPGEAQVAHLVIHAAETVHVLTESAIFDRNCHGYIWGGDWVGDDVSELGG